MKKIIGAALLSTATAAFAAGGPFDGIYNCLVTGGMSSQAFVSLTGYPNGDTVFTVAALTPTTDFFGYGIGQVSGNRYAGSTMFGTSFNFTKSGHSLSGTIGLVNPANGSVINAAATCNQIW